MLVQKLKSFLGWKEKPTTQTKKTGTIKYFNRSRGFGFIRSSETAKDVYVHVKDAKSYIRSGKKVQFDLEFNDKGLRARNVELI